MTPTAPDFDGDFEVLSALLDWCAAGRRAALVTVLRTWGSSPRPPGSLLAIRHDDGQMVGSVSGGCVESDLVSRYRRGELPDQPTCIDYGVDPAGAARFGLPCGGRLELLVEQPEPAGLEPILAALRQGRVLERRVCLATGEASLHPAQSGVEMRIQEHTVCKLFGPQWRLLLVGAGQLADLLARLALMLGFRVVVCDPRPGLAPGRDGVEYSSRMPDDLIAELDLRPRTAVVTLAHDPKLDDMALMEALRVDEFFYVGALGSRRASEARRARLSALGVSPPQLARLRAPVGIAINSHTPAEIAVAIAADLVAARNDVDTRQWH